MGTVAHDDSLRISESPMLRTALVMLRAGLRPVPVYPGQKKPIGENWGLRVHTEQTLRELWKQFPGAGVGILLGDDGHGGGVIDIEVDDVELAAPVLARMFPDGPPDTLRFYANLGPHYLLRYDQRLAKYRQTIIKGRVEHGEIIGNTAYVGMEIRIGTIVPSEPVQEQTVIPPTPKADGTARQWIGPGETLLLPEGVFDDLSHILPIPESVLADLDRFAVVAKPPPTSNGPPPPERPRKGKRGLIAKAPGPRWDIEEVKAAIKPHYLELAKSWGLDVTASRAGSKGFIQCRAFDREDKTPSAGLNLESGVYYDFGTNLPGISFFDLSVQIGQFADLATAVNELGRSFNVPPAQNAPKSVGKSSEAERAGGENGDTDTYNAYRAGLDNENELPVIARSWPEPPDDAIWHGPAGRLALAVDPYTEADPVGVLIQILVGFGNLIGRTAYFQVGATRHYTNLFCCTAGPTALGRKGTAWDIVKMALSYCDPDWVMNRVTGGLVSGEGLIWEVRDEITGVEASKNGDETSHFKTIIRDPGVADKRLLAVETELGGMLKVLMREGNNLSALIRQAWDSGFLRSMAKNNPGRATDAHISIIGHTTEHEVSRHLSQTEAANGFANRFLWVAVRQSKYLPDGALIPREPIQPILDNLHAAAQMIVSEPKRLERDADARTLWHSVYEALCHGKLGLLGSIVSRAVPQVMRMATIYAVMDFSSYIKPPHLEAALALWAYCERSATYIFGDSLGDKDADHLLSVLRTEKLGLTRNQIRCKVFSGHRSSDEVGRILGRLLEHGLVFSEVLQTGGRPATVWTIYKKPEGSALSAESADKS